MNDVRRYVSWMFIFGLFLTAGAATQSTTGNMTIASFTAYPANVKFLRDSLATLLLQRSSVSCAAMCFNLTGCAGFLYDEQTWTCRLGRGLVDLNNNLSRSTPYQKVYYLLGLPAVVACSSVNMAITQCQLPALGVNLTSVSLYRQMSQAACTKNTSFWLDDIPSLWVTSGCRGMFSIDA
ncbi:hypothetical protein Btru_042588 [Bulinus truncatus]|nr:hypothetical protein Btru_042588 [Bulinus truncatus]